MISLKQTRNEAPTTALTADLFRTACNIVSCVNSTVSDPTECKDEQLSASFAQFRTVLPADFVWPHREGIHQALIYASQTFMANVKVDVVQHFEERIRRWLMIRLKKVITQKDVTEKHLWMTACRMVDTIVWKEKREGAVALAAGRSWPEPPKYKKPTSVASLLGQELTSKIPSLNVRTQDEIWQLFEGTLLKKVGGALPLCPTNYDRVVGKNDK